LERDETAASGGGSGAVAAGCGGLSEGDAAQLRPWNAV
jgi:hypothetical protein